MEVDWRLCAGGSSRMRAGTDPAPLPRAPARCHDQAPFLFCLMIRKAFKMSVHPAAHAEYERRHNPIWKELEETLVAHGVKSYSIFLDPETSELFAYAEIENEERWQAIARTAICQRWWYHMRDLMPANPDNSPTAVPLREVFHLPDPKG